MKVSTRIVFGIGVLMVLGLLALVYQVHINQELQSVNHDLSAVNLLATHDVVRMEFFISVIDEFSRKYFLSDREHYGSDLEGWCRRFESYLSELQQMPLSDKERTDIAQVAEAWNDYRQQWAIEVQQNPQGQT